MQIEFEELINGLLENNVGISNHFLTEDLSNHLNKNLLNYISADALQTARIGNEDKRVEDNEVRSDRILWLDKSHGNMHENAYLEIMDGFISHLNMTCYTGITDAEFHYSLFEKGSFYTKHLDQFQDNSSRKYSLVSYLNDSWKEGDGGELKVYREGVSEEISPTSGKTVFFKSNELEHEVLITAVRRMSIAGWLKT